MKKALLIFGSKSDSDVYAALETALQERGISCELRIASAHRTPKEVEIAAKKTNATVIIAGAGLSAALPGVVASHTIKPVIGIPIAANYKGIDSFLSIAQMPAGIPVLACGVENVKEAADYAAEICADKSFVALVKRKDDTEINAAFEKASKIFDSLHVSYAVMKGTEEKNAQTVYIEFVKINSAAKIERGHYTTIYVPVAEKTSVEDALKAMKLAGTGGLWVGLNRGENAALAAMEILNINDKYAEALEEYRDDMRIKMLEPSQKK